MFGEAGGGRWVKAEGMLAHSSSEHTADTQHTAVSSPLLPAATAGAPINLLSHQWVLPVGPWGRMFGFSSKSEYLSQMEECGTN